MSEFHHAKSRLNETFFAGENGHSYIFLYVKITWFCFFFLWEGRVLVVSVLILCIYIIKIYLYINLFKLGTIDTIHWSISLETFKEHAPLRN